MKANEKFNQELKPKNFAKIFSNVLLAAVMLFSVVNVSAKQLIKDKNKAAKVETKEKELKVEAWMLDEKLFEKMIQESHFLVIEESEPALESWMLDVKLFQNEVIQNYTPLKIFADEMEEEIPLESWMLDIDVFFKNLDLVMNSN